MSVFDKINDKSNSIVDTFKNVCEKRRNQ